MRPASGFAQRTRCSWRSRGRIPRELHTPPITAVAPQPAPLCGDHHPLLEQSTRGRAEERAGESDGAAAAREASTPPAPERERFTRTRCITAELRLQHGLPPAAGRQGEKGSPLTASPEQRKHQGIKGTHSQRHRYPGC